MPITCDQSEMANLLLLLLPYTVAAQHMSGISVSAMKMTNWSVSRAVQLRLSIVHPIMAILYLKIFPALVRKVIDFILGKPLASNPYKSYATYYLQYVPALVVSSLDFVASPKED